MRYTLCIKEYAVTYNENLPIFFEILKHQFLFNELIISRSQAIQTREGFQTSHEYSIDFDDPIQNRANTDAVNAILLLLQYDYE